ncbi:hypothetical protein PoB_006876400 [Plakobranchus ocellatus]|uniref:Uncharacterized protein n=1 Tax=Plakobranchus ocellatus TaxID=259542 RepID=A0AAV4DDI1_9GAST|nr:hypothetical protein PoB_006876400 [Plakobranchus ocellatus]
MSIKSETLESLNDHESTSADEIPIVDINNKGSNMPMNPFCFPERHLFKGLVFNGVPVIKCHVSDDSLTHIKKIRELELRTDDVIIAAYPKCGELFLNGRN